MNFFVKIIRNPLSRSGLVGGLVRRCIDWYESLYGPVYAQRHHKEAVKRGRSIIAGLDQIRQRWPEVKSGEQQAPVFILSAGWRSGSTMLQRLIMTKQKILIWGEPYSHARIISHLAVGVSAVTNDWPQDEWFIDQYDLDKLDSTFVANMYPSIAEMQKGCTAYFEAMLEMPARKKGYERWGLKDVRLTIDDAHFLKWLYPEAKFIFICRNPFDAYKSYRQDRSWYEEWPDKPVFTATEFGRNWSKLVSGFHHGVTDLGGLFIRYEDILNDEASIDALENYLGFEIDSSSLRTKVGSHQKSEDKIPLCEKKKLNKEVGDMAQVLGYKYTQ